MKWEPNTPRNANVSFPASPESFSFATWQARSALQDWSNSKVAHQQYSCFLKKTCASPQSYYRHTLCKCIWNYMHTWPFHSPKQCVSVFCIVFLHFYNMVLWKGGKWSHLGNQTQSPTCPYSSMPKGVGAIQQRGQAGLRARISVYPSLTRPKQHVPK